MKRLFSRRKASQPSLLVAPSTQIPAPRPGSLQPKFVAHPCPYGSINVLVTTDSLVLSPNIQGVAKAVSHVKISWGKDAIVEEIEGDTIDCNASTTVYGIVGILRLFHASYLLVITSCTEVGELFDENRTVFKVDSVTSIPLEHARAVAAVNMLGSLNTHTSLAPSTAKPTQPPRDPDLYSPRNAFDDHINQQNNEDHSTSTSHQHVTFAPEKRRQMVSSSFSREELDVPTPSSSDSSGYSTPISSFPTSPVAKALAARLSFWNRLPKNPLNSPALEAHSSPDMIDSLDRRMANGEAPAEVLNSIISSTAPPPSTVEERHTELEEKIVKETTKEFVKGSMFFSYSFDITTSLQRKQQQIAKLKQRTSLLSDLQALDEQPRVSLTSEEAEDFPEPQPTLPLWRRVDRKYWWNELLSRPFIDAGLHSYVLPIMQGYYQIASFRIPASIPNPMGLTSEGNIQGSVDLDADQASHTVDYILVSRRSRDRAGLRYQRRGIDDDANVANFVETETIMRIKRGGRSNVFSYIQIRGSIPLFWTQSGYGLKPPPQLSTERTPSQSMDALKRHFARTLATYGPLTVVNLAEQHGKEGAITSAFRENMGELGSSDVRYHEYDFHAETKGMRYENISKLIAQLERIFETQGFLWVSGGIVMSQQKGVFRVNCIDCLDRTNVVQSAFARFILQSQLEAVALPSAYEAGDRTDADVIFNDVWANNGDAISRAYAGTSALKGDFTRTGKRDLGGLINDGLNSLSRVYTSTFNDWFSQAVIDFFLGNRTLSVFSEFLLNLSSTDPRELIRITKIRAAAIETCSSRVLSEGEKQIGGWTLFSPVDLNTRLNDNFEEKVLLLTAKAIYIVSYDYTLEKVKLFTRIPLGDVTKITKGIYILSPLEEASRNPDDNFGFLISFLPSRLTTRVTSYSVRNTVGDTRPSQPSTPNLSRIFRPQTGSRGSTVLSKMLSNVALVTGAATGGSVVTAAFKALPADHIQLTSDVEDPVASAATCRDAVNLMVEKMHNACVDIGSTIPGFVVEEDIVSLSEAQRMTSIYAKLEYNFKRLLWLGS